jgi:site-specific recombinase XerD
VSVVCGCADITLDTTRLYRFGPRTASTGRPIKGSALTLLVHRAAKQAGLTKRCKVHGLRKAASRRLAEHGATAKKIAATTGQKTLKEIERYTAAADQERLSTTAIGKLPRKRTKNESV